MLLPTDNTFRALRQLFRNHLEETYGQAEADAILRITVEEALGVRWHQGILGQRFSESDVNKVSPLLERLSAGEPVQYVLGMADFSGLRLRVSRHVLIPRPETEELCHIILEGHPEGQPLRVLDIGTGSGCIPIALKHARPAWQVEAMDVSGDALAVAQSNAALCGCDVRFSQQDIFSLKELDGCFDIIVSNPPYVAEQEKAEIMAHVMVHEPHLALFVPSADTLLFYRAIAKLAASALNPEGRLYLEINERFGPETAQAVREAGLTDVCLMKDLSGKDRFIRASAQAVPSA